MQESLFKEADQMGIFQPDKMGGVDYGEALKKIETAIANKDKANAAAGEIDSSTTKKKTEQPGNLEDEEDNHDDLYNQVIDEDGDIVREGEPTQVKEVKKQSLYSTEFNEVI